MVRCKRSHRQVCRAGRRCLVDPTKGKWMRHKLSLGSTRSWGSHDSMSIKSLNSHPRVFRRKRIPRIESTRRCPDSCRNYHTVRYDSASLNVLYSEKPVMQITNAGIDILFQPQSPLVQHASSTSLLRKDKNHTSNREQGRTVGRAREEEPSMVCTQAKSNHDIAINHSKAGNSLGVCVT